MREGSRGAHGKRARRLGRAARSLRGNTVTAWNVVRCYRSTVPRDTPPIRPENDKRRPTERSSRQARRQLQECTATAQAALLFMPEVFFPNPTPAERIFPFLPLFPRNLSPSSGPPDFPSPARPRSPLFVSPFSPERAARMPVFPYHETSSLARVPSSLYRPWVLVQYRFGIPPFVCVRLPFPPPSPFFPLPRTLSSFPYSFLAP